MKRFTLEQLTAGIRDRNVGSENARLVEKWSRTGLLKGLSEQKSEDMARLLENQAAEVLREANALSTGGAGLTSSGQVRGFSNIAFPIVRRVFGGLVANELVSIQPMSLPSGLLFYLDYTYGSNVGGLASPDLTDPVAAETYSRGDSIYNNPTGKGVRSGSLATGGQYDLVGAGFTKVHSGSGTSVPVLSTGIGVFSGATFISGTTISAASEVTGTSGRHLMFDPQVESDLDSGAIAGVAFALLSVTELTGTNGVTGGDLQEVSQIAVTELGAQAGVVAWGENYQGGQAVLNLRRLNQRGDWNGSTFTPNPLNGDHILVALRMASGETNTGNVAGPARVSMALADSLDVDSSDGSTLTIPSFESDFGATPSAAIPEIDIKVESIAVTATTRKLRARWSPELAQDLNAYHSLDAEVELTQILSEHVALEIDREILGDLLREGNAANLYWSRAPGKFVNKETGTLVDKSSTLSPGPAFTGSVRDWYETLVETIIDVSNTIHRKTLRGSANFIVVSPDVATILEASAAYRPSYSVDGGGQVSAMTLGAEKLGTLSNRFTVYKDPYFPRNKVLVGFKGGSYLETGYVYAPYVPLIVTPTIFAPEDFTPRKGVMTRYGKKMVRSDFYGSVTVLDLNII